MKTIKTSFTQSGTSLYMKALIAGTTTGALTTIVLLCVLSLLLLISKSLPLELLSWISMGICSISCFISGYTTSRITKANGLIVGGISGVIIFLIVSISGLTTSASFTYLTLIKFILLIICGAVGGIKGVYKKEKIRIK